MNKVVSSKGRGDDGVNVGRIRVSDRTRVVLTHVLSIKLFLGHVVG